MIRVIGANPAMDRISTWPPLRLGAVNRAGIDREYKEMFEFYGDTGMLSADTLGAGFTLASQDLDIRGAGNLLGEEQSGQMRDVGYELYQSMLE